MNRISNHLIVLALLLTAILPATYAQTTAGVFNYTCDFEDPEEIKNWDLAIGPKAASIANKWVIDTAINNGGTHALYVSNTQGKTTTYSASTCVILAARTITLRNTGEDYTLSFDWIAHGYKEGGLDGLMVAFVPVVDVYGDSVTIASVNSSILDADIESYCLELSPTESTEEARLMLRGQSTWQTCSTTISKGYTDQPCRLVFIWRNGTVAADPGACVDNIVILDGRACAAPKKLKITTTSTDSLILNWQGDADKYEVGCYSYEQKTWQIYTTDTTTYTFTDVPEGFCDFYVRTICWDTVNNESFYSGKAMANQFIYYPGNHCIDYITLTDENCYISTAKTREMSSITNNSYYTKQMVDNGSDEKSSRHTHHYSKTETDPRTGGRLKTVPDGEIASVRLGNWDVNSEAERAEFQFYVDAKTNPILILKYAVVLQQPNESCNPQSGFLLRVLNSKGTLVSSCASADFDYRDAADAEWEKYIPEDSSIPIRWKDWTTLGVNLEEYDGQTLTIQLTTYDCGGGGHYGYAYFTLGCDNASLDGEACDGSSTTEFRAPSGFDYKWYFANDPLKTTLSTDQVFTITDSLDTNEYAVDVIFKEQQDCSFTLYASAKPHYPVGDFSYKISQRDCRNYITFTNNSRMEQVERHKDGTPNDTLRLSCDGIEWDFGKYNSLVPNLKQYKLDEMEFPQEGDTFQVSVTAVVNNCDSTFTQTIYLPATGHPDTENWYIGCKGYPYTFRGTNPDGSEFVGGTYYESGDYRDTIISSIGCDSVIVTRLMMQDTLFSTLDTIIMVDHPLMFNDTLRDKSGTYVHATKSSKGCDSIATLNLYVHEYLIVNMPSVDSICATADTWTVPFSIQQGRGYKYSVIWQKENDQLAAPTEQAVPKSFIDIDVSQPIVPDIYPAMVIFHDSMRQFYPQDISDDTLYVKLKVQYPDSVITQRWNDVISLRDMDYNGGFDLVEYQWFKNGTPIEGATQSYYYAPEGLDMTAEYAALVTRAGDSLQLMTCSVIPTLISTAEVPNVPTLVERGHPMSLIGRHASSVNGSARWTTIYGVPLDLQTIVSGEGIVAPNWGGLYLLTIEDTDGNRKTYSVIVQ